jgi:HK97 gp10 family phage protein
MAKETFTLQGFDEVRRKLALVKDEVRGKATRRSTRFASGIALLALRQSAAAVDDPKTARRIVDNLDIQFGTRVFRQTGKHLFRIGIATDYNNIPKGNPDTGPKGNTPHWHFKEYGTKFAREKPYMRNTFRSKITQIINRFAGALNWELDKILKK